MPVAQTFDEVLLVAVNYFVENGFGDAEQLSYWNTRLEKAARRELISTTQLTERLKYTLSREYIRLVEGGMLLTDHPGIQRSAIAAIRPQLRNVLTNRVMAGTTLIRQAREEEIANVLRRFTGWASSLPAGPSSTVRQPEVRRSIKSALRQAALREQRLLVYQTRKLRANIHATVAEASGAIAAIWISNWRQPLYDYRDEHREFAERSATHPYLIRDSWAHRAGRLDTIGATFIDQLPHQPAQMPYCQCHYEYIYNLDDLPLAMVKRIA